jgi:hypothetical protein
MIILGVDPGLGGALFLMDTDGSYSSAYDMPTFIVPRGGKNKRDIDARVLASALWGYHRLPIGHAFVEAVNAMPGQGVTSMFAFGKAYGIILGIIAAYGVPYTLVSPAKWKKALQVPASKDGARARASQLLPHCAEHWPLKKHEARAEAALLCHYGHMSLDNIARGVAA